MHTEPNSSHTSYLTRLVVTKNLVSFKLCKLLEPKTVGGSYEMDIKSPLSTHNHQYCLTPLGPLMIHNHLPLELFHQMHTIH